MEFEELTRSSATMIKKLGRFSGISGGSKKLHDEVLQKEGDRKDEAAMNALMTSGRSQHAQWDHRIIRRRHRKFNRVLKEPSIRKAFPLRTAALADVPKDLSSESCASASSFQSY